MINQETEEKKKKQLFSQCYQVGNTSSTRSCYGARRDKEEADTCVDLALQPSAMLKAGQCIFNLWRKEAACAPPLSPPLISG